MCASMYTIGKYIHIEWSKWGDVYQIEGRPSMIDDKIDPPPKKKKMQENRTISIGMSWLPITNYFDQNEILYML